MRRLTKVIILSAMVAAALAISCQKSQPATKPTGAGEWRVETVDVTGEEYGYNELCLTLDDRGSPHILYFRLTEDEKTGESVSEVKYARRTDGKWKVQTVESAAGYIKFRSPSLALDRRGHPHISYAYVTGNRGVYNDETELRYARSDGRRWEVETADAAGDGGHRGNPAIALDDRGAPFIFYYYDSFYDGKRQRHLKYARRTGNRWDTGTVAPEIGFNYDVSAAADARGRPIIVYDVISGVQYGRLTNGRWDIQELEFINKTAGAPSFALALDNRGNPCIAYYYAPYTGDDVSTEDLKYARWAGGAWQVETVDAPGNVGWGCALALDSRGFPHISYRSSFNLKFAHWTGTAWFVQTVAYGAERPDARAGIMGPHTAVAVDGDDRPHIAYLAGEDGELKYASWTGGAWKTPVRREAEIIRDRSADGFIVKWGPGVSFLETGGPWPAPVCDSDIWEVLTLYAEPGEEATKTGEIRAGTPVEVLDGRSVWTPYEDIFGAYASYGTWLKVRAVGVEGWLPSRYVTRPDALVGFTVPYSPLRERPSTRAPAVRPEEPDRPDGGWGLTAAAPAGAFFPLSARCRGWLSVAGGWLPADTPGLVFYVPTYEWFPYTKDMGRDFQYTFYFPVAEYVTRVIYVVEGYCLWFELNVNPLLTVTAANGEFDSVPESRRNQSWHETGIGWFEAVLPRPVKRDDITSITFTLGEMDEKFNFTVDPREAWANGAED